MSTKKKRKKDEHERIKKQNSRRKERKKATKAKKRRRGRIKKDLSEAYLFHLGYVTQVIPTVSVGTGFRFL